MPLHYCSQLNALRQLVTYGQEDKASDDEFHGHIVNNFRPIVPLLDRKVLTSFNAWTRICQQPAVRPTPTRWCTLSRKQTPDIRINCMQLLWCWLLAFNGILYSDVLSSRNWNWTCGLGFVAQCRLAETLRWHDIFLARCMSSRPLWINYELNLLDADWKS